MKTSRCDHVLAGSPRRNDPVLPQDVHPTEREVEQCGEGGKRWSLWSDGALLVVSCWVIFQGVADTSGSASALRLVGWSDEVPRGVSGLSPTTRSLSRSSGNSEAFSYCRGIQLLPGNAIEFFCSRAFLCWAFGTGKPGGRSPCRVSSNSRGTP